MQTSRSALLLLVLVLTGAGIRFSGTSRGGESSLLPDEPTAASTDRRRPKVEFVFSLLPKSMQRNPVLDMTVFTEMTDAGRNRPQPSRESPIYYESFAAGYRQLGHGANEQPPPPEELIAALEKSLGQNGYVRAEAGKHAPALLLIFHWGSHNRISPEFASADPLRAQQNLYERALLIGGDKFADRLFEAQEAGAIMASTLTVPPPGGESILPAFVAEFANPTRRLAEESPTMRYLVEQAGDDVYFVVASAYDYAAVLEGQRILLWRTKMTANTLGVSMKQTLPPLIVNASPYFGRETNEAVPISRRGIPEGTVEIGTPTVVEVIEDPAPATSAR